MDRDGFLSIKDRAKDMIISGGFNIYPREIEEVLLRHPAVLEVSVIGRPHADLVEEVVACVVTRPGAGLLRATSIDCAWTTSRASSDRANTSFADLPKSNYGKVLKRELRDRILAMPRREGDRVGPLGSMMPAAKATKAKVAAPAKTVSVGSRKVKLRRAEKAEETRLALLRAATEVVARTGTRKHRSPPSRRPPAWRRAPSTSTSIRGRMCSIKSFPSLETICLPPSGRGSKGKECPGGRGAKLSRRVRLPVSEPRLLSNAQRGGIRGPQGLRRALPESCQPLPGFIEAQSQAGRTTGIRASRAGSHRLHVDGRALLRLPSIRQGGGPQEDGTSAGMGDPGLHEVHQSWPFVRSDEGTEEEGPMTTESDSARPGCRLHLPWATHCPASRSRQR